MSEQITPNPSVPSQVVAEVKFPKFINNLGIIPTSYKDSMSYYECLAWLCKYLEETVIPTVNENGEAVEELQNLYIELNSYVANYFENLDVQEEINNKLDDMVEKGTLQQILQAYVYDTWQILQPYYNSEYGTSVIYTNKDFSLLYDAGYTNQDTALTNALTNAGISKLDVFIISHFDSDHCGCMETILRNFCDENTQIYIGLVPDYSQIGYNAETAEANYLNFQALCTSLGLEYSTPSNNSTVTIKNNKLRFLNTLSSYASGYYTAYSDTNIDHYTESSLNNFSLVCEITNTYNSILLTGDVEQPAQTNIKSYIKNVDLLMVPHHNFNKYGDKLFFDNASPKLAFTCRGTNLYSHFTYFGRYQRFVKPIKNIQSLETNLVITSVNGNIKMDGKESFTAFDNYNNDQILTYLPDVGHCTFEEVNMFDFSLWTSDYIFGLWNYYRKPLALPYFRGGRYTALQAELDKIDPESTHNVYDLEITYKKMDFIFSSYAFVTYRIYNGTMPDAQKYVALIPEGYGNKELTGDNINITNVRYRNSFVAYVSDGGTSNTYIIPCYRLNANLSVAQYTGYWQNFSGSRFLTFIKVEITFSGSTYTMTYYRLVFDKTNNTWTEYSTNPELQKIKI